ncbi:hypothetical protein G6F53_014301 [Rhizopus delemar]|nr:hypothetical protein G6F53_014301 [Rhizopus delemar]
MPPADSVRTSFCSHSGIRSVRDFKTAGGRSATRGWACWPRPAGARPGPARHARRRPRARRRRRRRCRGSVPPG